MAIDEFFRKDITPSSTFCYSFFRWLIAAWITASVILSAGYSGMLKAAMTKPIYTNPISTLNDVVESNLQVEIVDYVEYEGSFSQNQDPIVKQIYDKRVKKEFSPFIKVYSASNLFTALKC